MVIEFCDEKNIFASRWRAKILIHCTRTRAANNCATRNNGTVNNYITLLFRPWK